MTLSRNRKTRSRSSRRRGSCKRMSGGGKSSAGISIIPNENDRTDLFNETDSIILEDLVSGHIPAVVEQTVMRERYLYDRLNAFEEYIAQVHRRNDNVLHDHDNMLRVYNNMLQGHDKALNAHASGLLENDRRMINNTKEIEELKERYNRFYSQVVKSINTLRKRATELENKNAKINIDFQYTIEEVNDIIEETVGQVIEKQILPIIKGLALKIREQGSHRSSSKGSHRSSRTGSHRSSRTGSRTGIERQTSTDSAAAHAAEFAEMQKKLGRF